MVLQLEADGFYGVEFNDETPDTTYSSFRLGFDTAVNVSQLHILDIECAKKYYDEDSVFYNTEIECATTYSCGI
jgi:hypothetical protein